MHDVALARVHFPGQERSEVVKHFIRRHPIAFVLMSGFLFGLIIVFSVLFFFLFNSNENFFSDQIIRQIGVVILPMTVLFVMLIFLILFIDFYLDVTIITDRRIIEIEQRRLFSRDVSYISLLMVQDVTSSKHGFLESVFNYGTVLVQSAGESAIPIGRGSPRISGKEPLFELENIPDPDEIAKQILVLVHDLSRQRSFHQGNHL